MIVNQKGDGDSGLTSQTFVAFAEPIDDSFVLHIPFPENCELNQQLARLENKWDIEKIDHYLLLRLVKTENGFSISLMNEEFVEEQIKTRQLAGKIESKEAAAAVIGGHLRQFWLPLTQSTHELFSRRLQ